MSTPALFPESPTLTLFDPLGALLGVGDGHYTYTFNDAVKLAGHACPTVAGAFVTASRALAILFPGETPLRGDVALLVRGAPDQGALGPFSQILTLLTGGAGENGFAGLRGQHARRGLLSFDGEEADGPMTCTFHRVSTGESVTLRYDPSPIPPSPVMKKDMTAVLSGEADEETAQRFRVAWRARVAAILRDDGRSTVDIAR